MSSIICLEISTLRRDGGLHCHTGLNEDSVAIYAAALKSGANFPPVVAFNGGLTYTLEY
ncbi:hypothetical protein [Acaryochloris marina]|uniref:hypothetical protein n=1 Tax=Acaryochloris marina TaxID=155978 RepID=UPI001BAEC5D4|nr:hypothetical protein [Acaryochloris marina]QUY44751.1 hypothetical protein I1H34_12055 [Acaryochloris marina S15]